MPSGLGVLQGLLLAAHAHLAHAAAQREAAHVRELPRLVRLPGIEGALEASWQRCICEMQRTAAMTGALAEVCRPAWCWQAVTTPARLALA